MTEGKISLRFGCSFFCVLGLLHFPRRKRERKWVMEYNYLLSRETVEMKWRGINIGKREDCVGWKKYKERNKERERFGVKLRSTSICIVRISYMAVWRGNRMLMGMGVFILFILGDFFFSIGEILKLVCEMDFPLNSAKESAWWNQIASLRYSKGVCEKNREIGRKTFTFSNFKRVKLFWGLCENTGKLKTP